MQPRTSVAAAFAPRPKPSVAIADVAAPMRGRDGESTPLAGAADNLYSVSKRNQGKRRKAALKPNEALVLLSQLTIMCQAGVDVAEALKSITNQATRPNTKAVLSRVSADVDGGFGLAESLHRQRALDETLVAAISAGEQAGALVAVLERVTQLLRNDMRLRSTVWSMMTYPLVLCGVTAMVLAALVFFVLPQFAQVFRDIGKPAPPLTQALLGVGEAVRTHPAIVLLGLVAVSAAMAWVFCSETGRQWWDRGILYFALARRASRPLIAGRAFRLLGTMLQTGVPLLDSIRLCRTACGNRVFRRGLETVERDVLQGKGLGGALATFTFLPEGASQMVATAEKTGKLGQVLQTVGEYFEDEGERALRDLIKVLEPTIIVGLGGLVAMVVLSVMLPLLDVSTMSH